MVMFTSHDYVTLAAVVFTSHDYVTLVAVVFTSHDYVTWDANDTLDIKILQFTRQMSNGSLINVSMQVYD